MTGQDHDKEWIKREFEQLQCATRMDSRWELANPNPLKFEIPRKVDSENSAGGFSRRTMKDLETGILLYNKELREYSGFFPSDGHVPTRIIQCVNGPVFDTEDQREVSHASPVSLYEAGTCVVVDS